MNAPTAPALVPTAWTTGSTEVFKTGTWRAMLARHVHAPSPCHQACPVGGDIAEWIGHAGAGDLRAAWTVLTRHNPFPAVAGRICHHPCEAACNRAAYDEALSICKLERFVGDAAIAEGWAFDAPAVARGGHVAIVGGGPAGLSAAFQLRRRGWRVTVHEAGGELGGLMRHGIPAYRLARDVLDAEIARIVALGVEIRFGSPVQTPEQFDALCAAHDAVFLATGAARSRRLPQLDYAQPGIVDGAAWLAACNAGTPLPLGPRVVVIGGGSAAFDAARSARRAGHSVTMVTLESRAQLPAQAEEVAEALEEGIALCDGAMLEACDADADVAGFALRCRRVRFEPGAQRGQFQLTPLDTPPFELHADAVISSVGQDAALEAFGLPAARGVLAVDGRQRAGAPRVWAGGDVASLARHVTEAIGMGKRAALAIHRALLGDESRDDPEGPPVPIESIATWYHPRASRAASRVLPPAERLADGAEVQQGLTRAQVHDEAARCFSCGSCTSCDTCVVVCPDLAVRPVPGGYEVLGDYCKGCGLCVRECPSGAMAMEDELR
jgi:NADPH-dependent glutamate synthase beta subunit-like oxidoreductase/Pyruvate/2-oxoacid:ferredoxin oxidoreductase delta subunit